jgi:hypothetical protein
MIGAAEADRGAAPMATMSIVLTIVAILAMSVCSFRTVVSCLKVCVL